MGATLGGLGGLCLFVGLGWMCARRRKVREEDEVAQVIQPFFTRGSYAGGSHSGVGVGGSGGGSSVSMRGNELVGGLTPSRISGKDDATVSFRVRRPLRNCTIELVQGDTVVKRRRMPKALPAEMIQIKLKASDLNQTDDLEVKVTC